MPKEKTNPLAFAEDLDTLIRTVYGEARGEQHEGREAVAWVVRNRAEKGGWWGSTLKEVCKFPWQFSCWNKNDPNRKKLEELDLRSLDYFHCARAALCAIMSAKSADPTRGSTHYHHSNVEPEWAKGKLPVVIIGVHCFYNDI